ncbi:MAG: hypothetical protein V1727_02360 [Candidatus Omnitrophota bacterium]
MIFLASVKQTSLTIKIIQWWLKRYRAAKEKVIALSSSSRAYELVVTAWQKIHRYSQESALGRLTALPPLDLDHTMLEQSWAKKKINQFSTLFNERISRAAPVSIAFSLAKELRADFYALPGEAISVVLSSAISINILIALLMHQRITPWGWLFRGLFLAVAFLALSCPADWPALKKNSRVFGVNKK